MKVVIEEYYGHIIEIGPASFWAHITRISDKEAYEAEFYLDAVPVEMRNDLMCGTRFRWYIERNRLSHELSHHFEFDYGAPLTSDELNIAHTKAKELLAFFRSREEDDSSRTNS